MNLLLKRIFRGLGIPVLLLYGFVGSTVVQADSLEIPLSSGDEVSIQRFQADGNTLILWTPSSFGMQPPAQTLAQELVFDGIETWLADLHDTFFVPRGRNSVDLFNPDLLAELFDKILKQSGKQRLLLLTTGSGSKPVLQAARKWQLQHPGNPALAGMILFHPSLYAGRPALGRKAQYLPIVKQTNLPIFIIQPTLSTTHFRVLELQKKLMQGGSQVYLQVIKDARDGFHVRPDDHLENTDHDAKKKLPALINRATKLLLHTPLPKQAARINVEPRKIIDAVPGLKKYTIKTTPPLVLNDLADKSHRLENYRGKVVLVSFWASWCTPCIKEMPSMNRLNKMLKGKPFSILGVNIGEEKSVITQFLKRTKVDFTILRDEDHEAYAAWKIYVVPSNFVIDARGDIRLGSVGAVEWDSPEVVSLLESLMNEQPSN